MKKILILFILGFILSGCTTYRFQKPATSGAQGYLACYDGKPILEYTVGKDKSLPDLVLAKERFKRRRSTVERYYKKMDQLESRLKEYFWDIPKMLVDLIGGVLRWPFVAVADYKYNRNPQYKERVDKLEEQKDELEKAQVNVLKQALAAYITEDLNKESAAAQGVAVTVPVVASMIEPVGASLPPQSPMPAVTSKVIPKEETFAPQETASLAPANVPIPVPVVESIPVSVVEPLPETKPAVSGPVIAKTILEPPVAVIVAKPVKGSSPLKVNFSGQKSYSKSGKIVAYDWDFGDGDISNKKNPENTYWSTTFGARNFTATLTIKDNAGNTSNSSIVIEVITK